MHAAHGPDAAVPPAAADVAAAAVIATAAIAFITASTDASIAPTQHAAYQPAVALGTAWKL